MTRAAIGLGSNLGDRAGHIQHAVGALTGMGGLVRVSSLYETAPVGGRKQGNYLNAVAVIDTELTPPELLQRCLEIERARGRERRERWGPRTLDLDILLYGRLAVTDQALTTPHPRLTQRRFVLEPLLEAWPDAVLPDGTPVAEFAPAVADQKVKRFDPVVPNRSTSVALFAVVALLALAIWWLGDWIFG